jgi:hypothetical protein
MPNATTPTAAAMRLRAELGVDGLASEDEVLDALAASGLRFRTFPAVPELSGLLYNRTVWVGAGQPSGFWRFVVAHELGHYHLGHGNGLYSAHAAVYAVRKEREADLFGGVFLWGFPAGDAFEERLAAALDAGVPEGCLLRFFDAASRLRASW